MTLKRNTSINSAGLVFQNNSGTMGYLEAHTDGSLFWNDSKSSILTRLNLWKIGFNANAIYDLGFYRMDNASNTPCPFGNMLVLPYRQPYGNNIPDFATQIFFPCGDTSGYNDKAFYRNSEKNSWRSWKEFKI